MVVNVLKNKGEAEGGFSQEVKMSNSKAMQLPSVLLNVNLTFADIPPATPLKKESQKLLVKEGSGKIRSRGTASKLIAAVGKVLSNSPNSPHPRKNRQQYESNAELVRQNIELTGKLVQLREFIIGSISNLKEKRMQSAQDEDLEESGSSQQSTPSNSTIPMETKITSNRSEEASMLRSVASTAHTSKTTVFNSTFKKSIHRVGLRSIVGRSLLAIFMLYAMIFLLSVIFIVVRISLLGRIDGYLQKQSFLIDQEAALTHFHRVELVNEIAQVQMLNSSTPKIEAKELIFVENLQKTYDNAIQQFGALVDYKYEEIWQQKVTYLLPDNSTYDVRLGNIFRNLLSDFQFLQNIKFNQYFPPMEIRRKSFNSLKMIIASMDFFLLLQKSIDSLMVVDTNLLILGLVCGFLSTVALVWTIIGISQKTTDFFNRCSVIFDRIDPDLLATEAMILESAMNLDQFAFSKVCLYSALRYPRRKKTNQSHSVTLRKELENSRTIKETAKSKKETNIRILPVKDNEKKTKKGDSGRLKRVNKDLKMSKRSIIFISLMVLLCLTSPVLLDWAANVDYRRSIKDLNDLHKYLGLQSQHSPMDITIALLKIDGFDSDATIKRLHERVDDQANFDGFSDLYATSQLIRAHLGSSYIDGNLCEWPDLTSDLAAECIKLAKNQAKFAILNAVSIILQGIEIADTLIEEGRPTLLANESQFRAALVLTTIVEKKVRGGAIRTKELLQITLFSYLGERSLVFCLTMAAALSLIVIVHYWKWLLPTSIFWRRVARTLAILPKNIIMQSNFFMKAHFEHIINSR